MISKSLIDRIARGMTTEADAHYLEFVATTLESYELTLHRMASYESALREIAARCTGEPQRIARRALFGESE